LFTLALPARQPTRRRFDFPGNMAIMPAMNPVIARFCQNMEGRRLAG